MLTGKDNVAADALTPKQAAHFLGLSLSQLAVWRSRKEGPAFYKIGQKIVLYKKTDLYEWLESHRMETNSGVERSDGLL